MKLVSNIEYSKHGLLLDLFEAHILSYWTKMSYVDYSCRFKLSPDLNNLKKRLVS